MNVKLNLKFSFLSLLLFPLFAENHQSPVRERWPFRSPVDGLLRHTSTLDGWIEWRNFPFLTGFSGIMQEKRETSVHITCAGNREKTWKYVAHITNTYDLCHVNREKMSLYFKVDGEGEKRSTYTYI